MLHLINLKTCGKIERFTTISLITILFFVYCSSLKGQSHQFIRYAEDEGLINTLVKSVTTDLNGFIWIATDDGLFRYDGRNFNQILAELPSKYVKSVCCAPDGDIIASTDLGVVRIESTPQTWSVSIVKMGSVKEVDSLLSFPKTIYKDSKGVLWISDNHKIYRFSGNDFTSYSAGKKAFSNNFQRSFSFAEDGFGNIYSFSEPGYVFRYDQKKNIFIELVLPQRLSNVQCVLNVGSETILVSTHTGVFELQFDVNGTCRKMKSIKTDIEISSLISLSKTHFLAGTWANGLFEIEKNGPDYTFGQIPDFPGKNVNHLWLADDGNIWIGSDNGLFLMKTVLFGSPYQKYSTTYIQDINEFSDGRMCFTDGGKVVAAHLEAEGVAQIVKTSKTTILQALPVNDGIWYSDVEAKIWFEDSKGTVIHTYNLKADGNAVFHLMADKAGSIWACQDANSSLMRITSGFALKKYGVVEGITSRPLITTIDSKGKVFAGSMDDTAFLFSYDAKSDRFVNLSKPLIFERNIDININDMAFDKKSVLWMGTSFGLIKFENGLFARINTGGMTADAVKAVVIDNNNNVWFGNSLGLHQLFSNELISFDERAGMTSKSIDYRCLKIDRNNRIWAGTVNGLVVSSPIALPAKTSVPVILDLLINNMRSISFKSAGTYFSDKSFVTMKVGVPDYPAKYLTVEMFLQGRDTTWKQINKSNAIILANLNPGKYKLLIRAKQYGNYIYSKPLEWEFTVKRIWYFRWWVMLIMAGLLFALFWIGVKLYTIKLKWDNENLERAINERTHEIREQKGYIEAQNQSMVLKNDELEKTNIELQEAKARAEEASDAKSKFLSVMTHELRTPMNAVIGFSHLLIQNNPRPDQLDDLKTLRFSAENLLALINNILDFNKAEAGKISLEQIDFDLKNIIEEIISTMMLRARHKNIDLHYNYDDQLPTNVVGDPLRLSQIMNNLLSNALKFTENGSVIIDLKLNSIKGKDVVIDFSVTDTGIGMDDSTLNTIFEAFTQGSSETSRKYGGTGLGLAITQKLMELYGSQIHVESEAGKGTRFYFSITFARVTNASAETLTREDAYEFTPFTQQRILLVEDNNVNRIIAKKFLLGWNLKVETAENGLIAVKKIQIQKYDLVLMDLQMPEMDGYQASAAIRHFGTEPYLSLPIIALTASSKADVYENIFLSGMNDFISKPFSPIELHEKVSKHLDQNHQ